MRDRSSADSSLLRTAAGKILSFCVVYFSEVRGKHESICFTSVTLPAAGSKNLNDQALKR